MRHELENEYLNKQIAEFNRKADKPLGYAVILSLATGGIVYQAGNTFGLDPEVSAKAAAITVVSGGAIAGAVYEIARNINLWEIAEDMKLQRDQSF